MKNKTKIILALLLGLINGYFLGVWREQWIEANDVSKQWIRLIIPCMMIIFSTSIFIVVFFVDMIFRKIIKREIESIDSLNIHSSNK